MPDFENAVSAISLDAAREAAVNPEQTLIELEEVEALFIPIAVGIAMGAAFATGVGTGVALYGVTK